MVATAQDTGQSGALTLGQSLKAPRKGPTTNAATLNSEMLKPSDQNPAYGLHIWRGAEWQQIRKYDPSSAFGVPHRQAYLAPDVYFFDGFGGQRVYIIPSHNLTIVRVGEVSMTYDDSVIVNLILATV